MSNLAVEDMVQLELVAHQVELDAAVPGRRRVRRELRRREGEDEPPASRIDRLQPQNIGQPHAIGRCVP